MAKEIWGNGGGRRERRERIARKWGGRSVWNINNIIIPGILGLIILDYVINDYGVGCECEYECEMYDNHCYCYIY